MDTNLDYTKINSLVQQNTIYLLKIKLPDGRYIFICDSFEIEYLGDKLDPELKSRIDAYYEEYGAKE